MRMPSLSHAVGALLLSPASLPVVVNAQKVDQANCLNITSWSDLTAALDAITIASAAAEADYLGSDNPAASPPQPPLLLLCPFKVSHDGTDTDGYDLTVPGLTIACEANGPGSKEYNGCIVDGTARHFNVKGHNVNLYGLTFSGSKNGALVVEEHVQGTALLGSNFLDNSLDDGDGAALSLQLGSSSNLISHCLFSDNLALNGGAISGAFATANIHSSTLHFNEAAGHGGAIRMTGGQPYIFSATKSRFLYNAANYGRGPAAWSDGSPCDSGLNYGCNNIDWSSNAPCDGIFTARDGACEVFADNCKSGLASAGSGNFGGGISKNVEANRASNVDDISSDVTEGPSASPSHKPSVSTKPSLDPSSTPSEKPTGKPSQTPSLSLSSEPSSIPSIQPSSDPSGAPSSEPSAPPSSGPSSVPSEEPTSEPTSNPSLVPSLELSSEPSAAPSLSHSSLPTASSQPSVSPSSSPTQVLSQTPSASFSGIPSSNPTISSAPTRECHMNELDRARMVSDLVLANTDTSVDDILNESSPQYKAFHWLLYEDDLYLCPEAEGIVQRYVMAVFYFATGGDAWRRCSATAGNDENTSPCDGETRFLSATNVCEWHGITCGGTHTVTKIQMEDNSLRGFIPKELSTLSDLVTLSLEKQSLSGTIPSTLGKLTKLLSLDLDFNELSGTIPSELSNIYELKLLDLNDNMLEGSIDAIANFDHLLFAQLHHNKFGGTISENLGHLKELRAITVFGNNLIGSVPDSICENRVENGGALQHLETDCGGGDADMTCTCCSRCWTEAPTSEPTANPSLVPSDHPSITASQAPSISSSPTVTCNMDADARSRTLLEMISGNVSDISKMDSTGTAQSTAFKWIVEEDSMYVCPQDINAIQRYVLALFYFATEGDSWLFCTRNNDTPCGRGVDTARWLSDANECNWSGVNCNRDGFVTGIIFDDNGLGGSLPHEIDSLTNLEVLKLENGAISGSIPSSIGKLTSLRELDLDFNQISGSIPDGILNLKGLEVLDLNNNYDLTGGINGLAHLTSLRFIQLHHTSISGIIAEDFGDLKELETLSVYATDLQGVVPRSVCRNRSTLLGKLVNLQADCGGSAPKVMCICCSMCFPMRRLTLDTAATVVMPTKMPTVPPNAR